jgi:hypothetical protein
MLGGLSILDLSLRTKQSTLGIYGRVDKFRRTQGADSRYPIFVTVSFAVSVHNMQAHSMSVSLGGSGQL